ncbi:hypothetical protein [Nocardia tengchongensis]|uniref:hypothetical protein n=1 Tax=Nocardia tengchongensis TaxID=2055889 RepID=UPI0036CA8D17
MSHTTEKTEPAQPSPDTVLAVGGWSRHARVLALASNGTVAFALVDTNGDGVEVNLEELYLGEDDTWHAGMSLGAGEFIALRGRDSAYVLGFGENPDGVGWAYGRADRAGAAQVTMDGRTIPITIAESLWWVWVQPVDESR